MFVIQKQLSVLNVPSSRVAMLYRSAVEIQLALPDLPSQMGSAVMVMLKGGGNIQVLVGLSLVKSCRNIFYVSESGEVPAEQADQELEEGLIFAESMGFILNDVDFCRMTAEEQEVYWKNLPICQLRTANESEAPEAEKPKIEIRQTEVQSSAPSKPEPLKTVAGHSRPAVPEIDLKAKRNILKENLGKLLASL